MDRFSGNAQGSRAFFLFHFWGFRRCSLWYNRRNIMFNVHTQNIRWRFTRHAKAARVFSPITYVDLFSVLESTRALHVVRTSASDDNDIRKSVNEADAHIDSTPSQPVVETRTTRKKSFVHSLQMTDENTFFCNNFFSLLLFACCHFIQIWRILWRHLFFGWFAHLSLLPLLDHFSVDVILHKSSIASISFSLVSSSDISWVCSWLESL